MNRQLRQARRREDGFTLIELLIVILILGILAGIAVFASGPFRDKATEACADANTEIGIIADAAADAGVTGDLYAQAPGDCVGTSGGGPGGGDAAPAGTVTASNSATTATASTSGVTGSPTPTFTFSWERDFDTSGPCSTTGYGTWGGSSSTATQSGTSSFYCYQVVWTATNSEGSINGTTSPVRGG
ncbi:MAG: prepilin-type N-terminal cleavage/methylation domain-containing protein [bacterium]|nr:prepilin-type N-terminal cleavage/methylation domain-containing protein [bacterium]